MRKILILLVLLVILATTLTACSSHDAYDTSSTKTVTSSNLDNVVTNDLTSDDLGSNDFVEIGEMI